MIGATRSIGGSRRRARAIAGGIIALMAMLGWSVGSRSVLLVFYVPRRDTKGPNQYGPDPEGPRRAAQVFA